MRFIEYRFSREDLFMIVFLKGLEIDVWFAQSSLIFRGVCLIFLKIFNQTQYKT